jgi:hypothetical protein
VHSQTLVRLILVGRVNPSLDSFILCFPPFGLHFSLQLQDSRGHSKIGVEGVQTRAYGFVDFQLQLLRLQLLSQVVQLQVQLCTFSV